MMNNNNVKANKMSVVVAIANRNGKALVLNGDTNKYSIIEGANSQKASLKAMCTLLASIDEATDRNTVTTIVVPKNLAFILRKDSVQQWKDNGNKTKNGTQLDDEFMELVEYISGMRVWLGNRVKVKMTGSIIAKPEEELVMKRAWNALDKVTGYKANTSSAVISRPNKPAFMSK